MTQYRKALDVAYKEAARHPGKRVAIDVDSLQLVATGNDRKSAEEAARRKNPSGRFFIWVEQPKNKIFCF